MKSLTFASPLTGNATFFDAFQTNITNSIRIVNQPDLVPRMPFTEMGFMHIWHEVEISSFEHSEIVNGLICYHSLNTYLHVLDDTISLEKSCQKKPLRKGE